MPSKKIKSFLRNPALRKHRSHGLIKERDHLYKRRTRILLKLKKEGRKAKEII